MDTHSHLFHYSHLNQENLSVQGVRVFREYHWYPETRAFPFFLYRLSYPAHLEDRDHLYVLLVLVILQYLESLAVLCVLVCRLFQGDPVSNINVSFAINLQVYHSIFLWCQKTIKAEFKSYRYPRSFFRQTNSSSTASSATITTIIGCTTFSPIGPSSMS